MKCSRTDVQDVGVTTAEHDVDEQDMRGEDGAEHRDNSGAGPCSGRVTMGHNGHSEEDGVRHMIRY